MEENGVASFYQVVANNEEQYSIWPAEKPLPAGWQPRGRTGTKAECLDYIETVWTDMRPRSLRVWMESQEPEEADTSQ
jgi:MbtH protein